MHHAPLERRMTGLCRTRRAALSALLLCTCSREIAAQGYSAAKAAAQMTVADGLSVQLFAAEPLVRQPVAMTFDERGRLWVIQYLQYPNPAGLKRVSVDRYSRTEYDRVPKAPPHGPHGADRITILEDDNGDGRADRAKDFVGGLNLASGMLHGNGGLYVLQAPYLLFYPDRNRDDVPDSDPEVLLSGFGMQDAHAVANSLAWGPDGWLYGAQGSTVTANIRGIGFQQGIWRYQPHTGAFELFAEGGGNTWGLDFDQHGNLFAGTNVGGYALLHQVQGGYYWKSFGKHGELHNPYAFGYLEHIPYADFRGGHVTCGGIVYQGDSFPPRFRNQYLAANLLSHAVYWHQLSPHGSTFRARTAARCSKRMIRGLRRSTSLLRRTVRSSWPIGTMRAPPTQTPTRSGTVRTDASIAFKPKGRRLCRYSIWPSVRRKSLSASLRRPVAGIARQRADS